MKSALEALGEPYASRAKDGLGALRRAHRSAVAPNDPRRLTGSIDLEACHEHLPAYANDAKWDYGVGFTAPDGASQCAAWVEVHNATPGDVRAMIAKLQTLRRWLASDGRALHPMTVAGGELLGGSPFRWIATLLSAGSSSFRAAAAAGLAPPRRRLRIP